MIEAPLPFDEAARLASLRDLGILYTPAEERFDRVTRLACRLLDVPLAMVTLIDADAQADPAALIRAADEALYRAKAAGRDRVAIAR